MNLTERIEESLPSFVKVHVIETEDGLISFKDFIFLISGFKGDILIGRRLLVLDQSLIDIQIEELKNFIRRGIEAIREGDNLAALRFTDKPYLYETHKSLIPYYKNFEEEVENLLRIHKSLEFTSDIEGYTEYVSSTLRKFNQIRGVKYNKETLYRGIGESSYSDGMSWTLDRSVAERFSNRFSSNGKIIERSFDGEDILYIYKNDSENEVLVDIKRSEFCES